jgi:hypothetical protein
MIYYYRFRYDVAYQSGNDWCWWHVPNTPWVRIER